MMKMDALKAIEELMHAEAALADEHDLYIRDNPDCPSVKYRNVLSSWHHSSSRLLYAEYLKLKPDTFSCTQ